ncbi:ABC transporter permease [Acetilactobacillus jinshanensis]|uniref:ABC transporter permease n=1 Tax=Acetilactobacillus jinshanensis TaxID=1720083 RepID=A0A4V1ALQ0_9LACO|nr:ABC transporter permease [Acetilactobacillus jinshanensis]QBP18369.1 ABC transporter permease [Acetilactobacillus jinshanensis]URL61233.1 ABC transporter permease [uncultured bacterium]
MDKQATASKKQTKSTKPTKIVASNAQVIWDEFKTNKAALWSAGFIIALIAFVIIASFFINVPNMMQTHIMGYYARPFSQGYLFGADSAGRSIAGQMIVGSRNSIGIAIGLTVISSTFGIVWGLISGYYGGFVDLVMQRMYDFFMIIPMMMFIIVLVTIIHNYNAITLTLIMSLFYWMGTSRLIRSETLAESNKDYVLAARMAGCSDFHIIFSEVMPNISSLIIVDTTLSFASNIGVETGLSYLGFGLPDGTPSLGTLIANAQDPTNITQYWWTWLPAALEIIILCLAISYVGQVLRRSVNAQQRRGNR